MTGKNSKILFDWEGCKMSLELGVHTNYSIETIDPEDPPAFLVEECAECGNLTEIEILKEHKCFIEGCDEVFCRDCHKTYSGVCEDHFEATGKIDPEYLTKCLPKFKSKEEEDLYYELRGDSHQDDIDRREEKL